MPVPHRRIRLSHRGMTPVRHCTTQNRSVNSTLPHHSEQPSSSRTIDSRSRRTGFRRVQRTVTSAPWPDSGGCALGVQAQCLGDALDEAGLPGRPVVGVGAEGAPSQDEPGGARDDGGADGRGGDGDPAGGEHGPGGPGAHVVQGVAGGRTWAGQAGPGAVQLVAASADGGVHGAEPDGCGRGPRAGAACRCGRVGTVEDPGQVRAGRRTRASDARRGDDPEHGGRRVDRDAAAAEGNPRCGRRGACPATPGTSAGAARPGSGVPPTGIPRSGRRPSPRAPRSRRAAPPPGWAATRPRTGRPRRARRGRAGRSPG